MSGPSPLEGLLRRLADSVSRVRWQSTEEEVFEEVLRTLAALGLNATIVTGAQVALAPREPPVGRVLPVLVHEHLYALIALGPNDLTSEQLAALELYAAEIGGSLEHQSLVEQVDRRNQELVLLNRLTQQSAAHDLPRVLELAVQAVAFLTQVETVALYLGDWDDPVWTLQSHVGADVRELETRLEAARVNVATGEVALSGPGWGACRYTVAQPVTLRGRITGAIVVGRSEPTPLRAEARALLTTAASQLAVHIENARLFANLRDSFEALERAQAELVKRERLAALGELAAVVAHEVRNPLGAIFNSVTSLRRILVQPSADASMLLAVVGEEANRLNRIVGDLLDFARAPQPQFEFGDLPKLLDDVIRVAMTAVGPAEVKLHRTDAAPLPLFPFDPGLLRQALINVALNAVQAMPRGGRLSVRTVVERDPPSGVRIEFEDTGSGVPAPLQARIFEPFFTTKASGTGLGLAVVKRIVDDHHGQVSVRSEVGQGTVVAISLPLRQDWLAAPLHAARGPLSP